MRKGGGAHLQTCTSLKQAVQLQKKHDEAVVRVKARRETATTYAEKLKLYINFVDETGWEPADWTVQKEIRLKEASFARVSLCTYQWGIEGKEKPW